MCLFSGKLSSIFILTVLFTTLLPPAVRSDPNFLQLPSDQQENGLCPLNPGQSTCPVKCFRPDPVCGVDGVTYWCGCAEAHCAGTRVKKFGYCEVGNGGSGPAGQALLLVHIIWLILLGGILTNLDSFMETRMELMFLYIDRELGLSGRSLKVFFYEDRVRSRSVVFRLAMSVILF
ncbi:hypothetical protein Sango_0741100 [Sesamum angolense]|uniref:Serine protease inhibitor, Kazal-type family protein n=1 Tax=Sesamum angolense TaxID=2727404 RepID=A0AAE1X1W3_9LAMI|nr:hypothetical protein Sango_0741100 [Sesamum angolense]